MTTRILSLLAFWGWASQSSAQWLAVPSPADRVFAFAQSGDRIFAGSEDSGLWLSTDGGASFVSYATGLPEMNFDIRSFEVRNDTIWAAIWGGGVCRSTDGGINWNSFNDGFATQAFVIGAKQIGDTLYAAVDYLIGLQPSGVYKTSIQQASWIRSGTGFPGTLAGVSSLVVSESGVMFVGVTLGGMRGNMQVSLDGGHTWLNRNLTSVQGVISLEADGDRVYAGTTNGIFVTNDNAENWERFGVQFQNSTVDDILISGATLFSAIDGVGVAYTADNGATWNVITHNLPIEDDYVSSIFIHNGKLLAGLSAAHGIWSTPLPTTGVDEDKQIPLKATLQQNYPNPFNPATTISFQMPQAGIVSLKVFDQLGREVKTLLHEQRATGQHQISFDAKELPSGIYVYQLKVNGWVHSRKMLLVK